MGTFVTPSNRPLQQMSQDIHERFLFQSWLVYIVEFNSTFIGCIAKMTLLGNANSNNCNFFQLVKDKDFSIVLFIFLNI